MIVSSVFFNLNDFVCSIIFSDKLLRPSHQNFIFIEIGIHTGNLMTLFELHDGAVGSAVAFQQEGSGHKFRLGSFPLEVESCPVQAWFLSRIVMLNLFLSRCASVKSIIYC